MQRSTQCGVILLTLALACGGVAAAGTNEAPPAWLLDGVAAQVNDETITISEIMNEIRNSAWIEMPKEEREKSLRKLYTETLDAFVNRRLILAAARVAELKLQAWVVEDRVQEIIDSRYKGNRALLLNDLTEHRVNYEEWRKGIEEEMMLMAMRSENVDKHVTVSPREVRSYYETNRQALVTSARVHLGRITLPPQPGREQTVEQLGAVVLRALDAGTNFATVARTYSKDDFAPRGGDRGWVDLDDLAPRLVQTLATIKTGQCSRLVILGETGMILQKIEEKGAGQPTLDEAWTQIERRLRMQKSEAIYRGWTARLRQQGFVKLFDLPPTSAEQ
jgi:peptidyl-prolyl cis-trans isomerase SurA